MALETKNLSDFWRHDRCHDRTGELISILQGAGTLIGNMGSGMRVEWSRNGMSYTDFAGKRVALDYAPLAEEDPMFRGSKVDEIIGYAAHEGGHCMFSHHDKMGTIRAALNSNYGRMPEPFKHDMSVDKEGVLKELCRLQNILEDAYIDARVASDWPVLGEYIRISRSRLDERTPVDLDAILNDPRPDRNAVVNLWISVALYGRTLPKGGNLTVRKAVQALMRITRRAMGQNDAIKRQRMVYMVARELWEEFTVKSAPLPQLPSPPAESKSDSNDGSGDSSPSGEQPDDQSADSAGDDEADDSDAEDEDESGDSPDESDGNGGDAEEDTDEDTQPEDSASDDEGTGASGDTDEDTDEDNSDAGSSGSSGDKDNQGSSDDALQDARGALTRALQQVLGAAQDNAQDGESAEIGNLDDYDAADGIMDGGREVMPVPDDVLEEVLDALDHELQDITEIVAATLDADPRKLMAQARKATYSPYLEQAIFDEVKDEVAEIERAFKRQQDVNSRTLRGRDKGQLDDRRLYKPFLGEKNFRKQRVVLSQPDRDVGLLLDVSESMGPYFDIVKATAAIFTLGLRKVRGINFAAWTYTGDNGQMYLTRITDSKMGGKLHLSDIIRNSWTPSGMAIAGAKAFLDTMPARNKVLIHFTDGAPQQPWHVITAVKKCRESGIEVYVIGMDGMEGDLRDQYGEGNYETISEVSDLPAAVTRIVRKLGAPQI